LCDYRLALYFALHKSKIGKQSYIYDQAQVDLLEERKGKAFPCFMCNIYYRGGVAFMS
jgi:hypothetical protein